MTLHYTIFSQYELQSDKLYFLGIERLEDVEILLEL